jgi:flagellar FliJ protein
MYHFKLETLLDHRLRQQEQCQRALADAQRVREQEQLRLLKLEEDQRRCCSELSRQQREAHGARTLPLYYRYLAELGRSLAQQQQRLAAAQQHVESRRGELAAAMKKRKVLERLKEKGLASYRAEQSRREQRDLDEMAVQRYRPA